MAFNFHFPRFSPNPPTQSQSLPLSFSLSGTHFLQSLFFFFFFGSFPPASVRQQIFLPSFCSFFLSFSALVLEQFQVLFSLFASLHIRQRNRRIEGHLFTCCTAARRRARSLVVLTLSFPGLSSPIPVDNPVALVSVYNLFTPFSIARETLNIDTCCNILQIAQLTDGSFLLPEASIVYILFFSPRGAAASDASTVFFSLLPLHHTQSPGSPFPSSLFFLSLLCLSMCLSPCPPCSSSPAVLVVLHSLAAVT